MYFPRERGRGEGAGVLERSLSVSLGRGEEPCSVGARVVTGVSLASVGLSSEMGLIVGALRGVSESGVLRLERVRCAWYVRQFAHVARRHGVSRVIMSLYLPRSRLFGPP